MLYASLDIETTGLDPEKDDILEFGAVLDDLKNIKPIGELPRFQCYFKKERYIGSPYALSMHPKIFRIIADEDRSKYNFLNPMKFGNSFKLFLIENGHRAEHDRVTINVAGKNFGAFDLQFLNKQTDLNNHVKIRHRIIDPSILFLSKDDDALPGTELCKERAGITGEVAHTAIDDAIDVIRLVRKGLTNVYTS